MNRWVLLEHKVFSGNSFDIHYDFLIEDKIDCLTWKFLKLPSLNEASVKIIKQKKRVNKEKDKRSFYIRIGLFSEINNVKKIESQLKNFGNIEINKNQSVYKVLLGPFANKNYTERVLSNLREKGFTDAIIENIN